MTFHKTIEQFLSSRLGIDLTVLSSAPISGGDINAVFKLNTTKGIFCLKQNNRSKFPKMLEKEALGLIELKKSVTFRIPQVIGHFEEDFSQFLLLEFIESGQTEANFSQVFGKKLAQLHKKTNDSFGWKTDNFIGSLQQSNIYHQKWSDFYVHERILPQLKLAFDSNKIDLKTLNEGEQLCSIMPELFPVESPSLLHGDLWSGNYLVDTEGEPVLIDPAVHFGHREMDLGMMLLFGGFQDEIFEVYNEHFPLDRNWRERILLTQIYPLLVHVNLFGSSYLQSVRSILQKYQ